MLARFPWRAYSILLYLRIRIFYDSEFVPLFSFGFLMRSFSGIELQAGTYLTVNLSPRGDIIGCAIPKSVALDKS